MALVPAFLRWFPCLAPKPPSAPWLVGPDADLLTLGATIGGEDICLSEEWSRNSVVIVGAPGRGRDSVLRSILGSVVAKGGGGIVMRSSPSGSLHRAVRKMAAARDRDDPQFLDFRVGDDRRGERAPASDAFNPFTCGASPAQIWAPALARAVASLLDDEWLEHANSQKRAVAMLEPVFGVLAWCVDEDLMDVPIDIGELGDCFDIARLCEFADPRAFPEMPSGIREGVARYLAGLPGYCEEFIWRQPPETVAHHDFVKRRVVSVLTRLAEDYPHILLGRQSPVDLFSVVRDRKLLVVDLPRDGDHGSPAGRFVLSLLKEIIRELTEHAADIAPSHRQESSFVVILDGVEDYWVRNMDLMVDDARVLGIPVIFAGQSFRSGKRDMDEDMAEIGIEASKVIMRRDGIAENGVREPASDLPASHEPLHLDPAVANAVDRAVAVFHEDEFVLVCGDDFSSGYTAESVRGSA